MREQLQQALVAIKMGQEQQARSVLAQLLKEEPGNVAGWVLLSKLAQTEVQKVAFLHKVLELDPENEYATSELAAVEGEAIAESVAAESVAEPEAEEQPEADEAVPAPAPEAALPPPEEATPTEETTIAAPATELPARQPEGAEEAQIVERPEQMPVSESPPDYDAQAEGDTLPPWIADEDAVLEREEPEPAELDEETAPPADLPEWLQEEAEQAWAGEEATVGEAMPETRGAVREAGSEEKAAPARVPPRAARASAAPAASSGVIIGLGILLVIIFLVLVYVVFSVL